MTAAGTKKGEEEVKLGDFVKLGKYTFLVGTLCELMILCQLGNQLFMMFSGKCNR